MVAVNGGTSFLPSRARIKNREQEEGGRPSPGLEALDGGNLRSERVCGY